MIFRTIQNSSMSEKPSLANLALMSDHIALASFGGGLSA